MGNYDAQEALEGWLTDSTNVIESVLVDGVFGIENGMVVDGLDPRVVTGETVTIHYLPSDERLDPVTFHGALSPDESPWFAVGSYLAHQGLVQVDGEESAGGTGGCMYAFACNYDAGATEDDGSCEFESCAGCTYPSGLEYDSNATIDDGSCVFEVVDNVCPADLNSDGLVSSTDLLEFLSAYGQEC